MNMTSDIDMTYNPQPPVFRQIAAFALGLVFAFTGGYSGMQMLGAAVGAPLIFAGAVRLYTEIFRLVFSFLPIGWLAAVIGFCGIGIVTSFLLAPAFQFSTALGVILTVVLMLCEVFVFIRDLRIWRKNKESIE